MARTELLSHAFRTVPRTGVIWVMNEAAQSGYTPADESWVNLGQGMPETGPLPGGPPRQTTLRVDPADQEYAPVAGIPELREAVAALYNGLYRRGMPSQYTAENVAIAGGGRAALTRVAAALGHINLGHFLPDYTAYEELLDLFKAFTAIPILLEPERGYAFPAPDLRREILGRGLGAVLISNPSNPTGHVIAGEELRQWVHTCRQLECVLLVDEFYSHYVWSETASLVSAAAHIEDVNRDGVVILDGLTKNWRYPGWRVSWIVAPKPVIEAVSSAGSFLDGGGGRPLQRAALELLSLEHTRAETAALQAAFRVKRTLMMQRLQAMGIRLDRPPEGTFYCWGSLRELPGALGKGKGFFRAALERQVITVPGEFFDVNPGKRRSARGSRFRSHVRFSFGPPEPAVRAGLDRLAEMIASG